MPCESPQIRCLCDERQQKGSAGNHPNNIVEAVTFIYQQQVLCQLLECTNSIRMDLNYFSYKISFEERYPSEAVGSWRIKRCSTGSYWFLHPTESIEKGQGSPMWLLSIQK